MKKLYFQLFSAVFVILLLLGLCTFCSLHAQKRISYLKEQLAAMPAPETVEEFFANQEQLEKLKEQVDCLEAQTKKAGETLAFFINYEYISRTSAAAAALSSAVSARSVGQYSVAQSDLYEALDSMERLEKLTFELFF